MMFFSEWSFVLIDDAIIDRMGLEYNQWVKMFRDTEKSPLNAY